jgi:hypothetical protein
LEVYSVYKGMQFSLEARVDGEVCPEDTSRLMLRGDCQVCCWQTGAAPILGYATMSPKAWIATLMLSIVAKCVYMENMVGREGQWAPNSAAMAWLVECGKVLDSRTLVD